MFVPGTMTIPRGVFGPSLFNTVWHSTNPGGGPSGGHPARMVLVGTEIDVEVSAVKSGGKGRRIAVGHQRGWHPIQLPYCDVVLHPIGVGEEVLKRVGQATERGASLRPVHQVSAARTGGLRSAQYQRVIEIPCLRCAGADIGWILRVVDMPEVIAVKSVGSYRAGPRRRADEYLKERGLVDLIRGQRIARDRLVVLDVERLCVWCGHAAERGHHGGGSGHNE